MCLWHGNHLKKSKKRCRIDFMNYHLVMVGGVIMPAIRESTFYIKYQKTDENGDAIGAVNILDISSHKLEIRRKI
jgi:hypothetical protein